MTKEKFLRRAGGGLLVFVGGAGFLAGAIIEVTHLLRLEVLVGLASVRYLAAPLIIAGLIVALWGTVQARKARREW